MAVEIDNGWDSADTEAVSDSPLCDFVERLVETTGAVEGFKLVADTVEGLRVTAGTKGAAEGLGECEALERDTAPVTDSQAAVLELLSPEVGALWPGISTVELLRVCD